MTSNPVLLFSEPFPFISPSVVLFPLDWFLAGDVGSGSSSSVPGSPAHARNLARRSPHSRTLSEEATTVQSVGGGNVTGTLGVTVGVSGGCLTTGDTTTGPAGSLAPVLPPGRKQHTSSDLLLNPANPPTGSATPTPTPPVLKPITSKPKRSKMLCSCVTLAHLMCVCTMHPFLPCNNSLVNLL